MLRFVAQLDFFFWKSLSQHSMAANSSARRSRSRSRERRRSRSRDRALLALRSELPFAHRAEPLNYAAYLRAWLPHLRSLPTLVDGKPWFLLQKEKPEFPGEVWARLEQPHVLHLRGLSCAVQTSLWHGEQLETATKLDLHRGYANGGQALVFNWPRAPRGSAKVIVSRLLGMSMFFNEARWAAQGFSRFSQDLHVHHLDDHHANCFLCNLEVELRARHVAYHNRQRRRR